MLPLTETICASEDSSSEGLADYFPFLFPDGKGVVLVLSAYFDDSEQQRKLDDPFCLGGYLFKPGGYKRFRRYWKSNVLRYRGRRFKYFHTTDLLAGRDEYEGLDIPDRVVILDHAVHAVVSYTVGGVGIHFDQGEFERKAPKTWPRNFGSIYTMACQFCLEGTAQWLRDWNCPMEVLYVFEQGHKFWREADEFLHAVGKNEAARKRFSYRNHLFDKKEEVGLQAADLYSWTVAKSAAMKPGATVPRSLRAFSESFSRLSSLDDHYKIYPVTGKAFDKFLADQLSGPPFLSVRHGPRRPGFR